MILKFLREFLLEYQLEEHEHPAGSGGVAGFVMAGYLYFHFDNQAVD